MLVWNLKLETDLWTFATKATHSGYTVGAALLLYHEVLVVVLLLVLLLVLLVLLVLNTLY